MKVYIDGTLYDKDVAKVSVFDHGFLYGDGVFEGIRVYNRCVFKLTDHIDRLYDSAKAIMLTIPLNKQEMASAVISTLKENKLNDGYIRIVVSRGTGDLGLDPRKCKDATVVIITDAITLYSAQLYEKGLDTITVPTRRNSPEALNPQIKSLNYLNNILAKIEATNHGVPEAIMMSQEGYVTECTGDNIILIKKNKLVAVPTWLGVLAGITATTVLDIARSLKMSCEEKPFTRYDIYTADELILTGTAAEVIPVVKVDGRPIGDGTVGPITKRLIEEFKKIVSKDGVKY